MLGQATESGWPPLLSLTSASLWHLVLLPLGIACSYYNGFGGKVEKGETVYVAALREVCSACLPPLPTSHGFFFGLELSTQQACLPDRPPRYASLPARTPAHLTAVTVLLPARPSSAAV